MKAGNKYNAIVDIMPETETREQVTFRQAGEEWLHVEYGKETEVIKGFDYTLNFRVQMVVAEMERRKPEGVIEINPAWRALSYRFDQDIISRKEMIEVAKDVERAVGGVEEISKASFPSRYIELPLTFDDSGTKKAIAKYLEEIKPGSIDCDPVLLSNFPWLARCNGVSVEELKEWWLSATNLVVGVGFIIGLIVFQPLERIYTIKMSQLNPPRTWTPRWALALTCIMTVESAGGYPVVGRSIPIVDIDQKHPAFKDDAVLFRVGDRLHFYEVNEAELVRIEKLVDEGSPEFIYKVTPGEFRVAEWLEYEEEHKAEIEAHFKHIDEAFAKMPVP